MEVRKYWNGILKTMKKLLIGVLYLGEIFLKIEGKIKMVGFNIKGIFF